MKVEGGGGVERYNECRGTTKLGALIIKFRDKKCPFWPQKCVPFLDPSRVSAGL